MRQSFEKSYILFTQQLKLGYYQKVYLMTVVTSFVVMKQSIFS